MKKYALWALIAFVGYWLISNPTQAAALIERGATGLGGAADGLSRFVNALS